MLSTPYGDFVDSSDGQSNKNFKDKEENLPKILLKEFASETSIPGVPFIGKDETTIVEK